MKHTPEACPMVDENNKKLMEAVIKNMDSLTAKYGIKLVSAFTDFPLHVIYNTYETPNMEAFIKFSMDPSIMGLMTFNTVENKVVLGIPEIKALLKIK